MILLDSSALVALLADEPEAREVETLLRKGDVSILSINLAETIDVLVRVRGHDIESVEDQLVPLFETALPVSPVDERDARAGAAIRTIHYHHKKAPLSLADCLLMGAAQVRSSVIATSDTVIGSIGRQLKIAVRELRAR